MKPLAIEVTATLAFDPADVEYLLDALAGRIAAAQPAPPAPRRPHSK